MLHPRPVLPPSRLWSPIIFSHQDIGSTARPLWVEQFCTYSFEDEAADEVDQPQLVREVSGVGNEGTSEQETVQSFLLLLSILLPLV